MKQFNFLKVALMSLMLLFAFCVQGHAQTVVFSENFNGFTGGGTGSAASSTDRATMLDTYTQTPGWTGVKVYEAGGTAKMGTGSALGSIQTPVIDLSGDGGNFTISFMAMAWSNDSTFFNLHVMNADTITETITIQNLPNDTNYVLTDYTRTLTTGSATTKIKFEASAASKARFFLDDLVITQNIPAPTATPVIAPNAGTYYASFDVTITCATEDAVIYYTIDNSTPDSVTGTLYTAPFSVSASTNVKAIAYAEGMEKSQVASAMYAFPVEVATIAAFKSSGAISAPGIVHKITGDVTFVYRNGRNIFVQDETGGLLIYDNGTSVITTEYVEGDVISGGICGTYTTYGNLKEMIPTQNTAVSTENDGPITIPTVTVAQIKANYNTYEAKLVNIVYAVFEEGTFTTGSASNIKFAQYGTEEMICRNYFKTLTNEIDSADINTVTGFVLKHNDDIQIAPRTNADIAPYTIPTTATPVASKETGFYATDIMLTLTCETPGSLFYYTTDGSTPTVADSLKYTAAIGINKNITIKAIAVAAYHEISDVMTVEYTFPANVGTPYANNFEGAEVANWGVDNGTATNKWVVGQAQGFDNAKLFISSTNGNTNKYNATQAATVHAYRNINVPANGAYLTFDYRVGGDASDYLAVSLLSEETMIQTGVIPAGRLATLTGDNEWKEYFALLDSGSYRLVFTWVNNNAGENQFPIAIDNIALTEVACVKPSNIVVTVDTVGGEVKANVSWTAADGQDRWVVEYGEVGKEVVYTKNVSGTATTILTNIQPNASYNIKVKAVCSTEESLFTASTFDAPCTEQGIVPVEYPVAESTGTNGNLPFYGLYGYSYTQQIYDAEMIPGIAGNIYKVSFYSTTKPTASVTGGIKMWMANTTKSTFSSNTDYIDPASFTLVYEASETEIWNLVANSWNTIELTTPFEWDGTSNLVIGFYEGIQGYSTSSFRAETTTGSKGWYHYNDNKANVSYTDPSSASGTKAVTSRRNYILLEKDGIACSNAPLCPTPTVEVSNVSAIAATISWDVNTAVQSWQVEYKKVSDNNWTIQNTTESEITLNNLSDNMEYEVRVKAICSENSMGEYAGATFTTLFGCAEIPQNIMSLNSSTSTIFTWDAGTSSSWEVQLKENSGSEWNSFIVNEPTITFNGLNGTTGYNFKVRSLCETDFYSDWAAHNFTTGCEPYTNFPIEEDFAANSAPDCWINYNNVWNFSNGTAKSTLTSNGNWLMTNGILLPEDANVRLSFDLAVSAETNEHFEVLISNRGTDPTTFAPIYVIPEINTEFETYNVVLPNNLRGDIVYIAFVHNAGIPTSALLLDNVVFSTCLDIPELTATNVTDHSVELSWDGQNNTQWQIEYSTDGNNWDTELVTTSAYTLDGLQYDTEYQLRVRTVCGENQNSVASEIVTITTECLEITSLPFTENFDRYPSGTGNWPNCWGSYTSHTTTTYRPYVLTSIYITSSPNVLRLYSSTTINTPYVIASLPRLADNIAIQDIQVKFNATATSLTTANSYFYVGVMTDQDDADSFVAVDTVHWSEFSGTYTICNISASLAGYTGEGRYIALKAYTGSGSVYLDDLVLDYHSPISSCQVTSIAVDSTAHDAVKLSWESTADATEWVVECKSPYADSYSVVGTVSTPSIVIGGLLQQVPYSVRIKANCEDDEGEWAEIEVASSARITSVPYETGFESAYDNYFWTTVNSGRNDWYFGTATSKDGGNSLYVSNNGGVTNGYANNQACQSWVYRDFYFTPSDSNYVFSFDWKCTGESTYDWISVYIGDPAEVVPQTSTAQTTPEGATAFTNPTKGTTLFNLQANWVHFETELDAKKYSGKVQRIYFRWRNDGSSGNPPAAIDNVKIEMKSSKETTDLAIVQEKSIISDACALNNIPVSLTVRQNGMAPLSQFTAAYTANGVTVEENVVLTTPLEQGDEYTHTFATPVTFTLENGNYIYYNVSAVGDTLLENNDYMQMNISIVSPVTVPYYQDFSSVILGTGGYMVEDVNEDGITWTITNGALQYTTNDMLAADDWFFSTCLDVPMGMYEISYDYNALGLFPESFEIFGGLAPNVSGMVMPLASHTGFTKSANGYHAKQNLTVPVDGLTIYLGIHASSLAGNAGITLDNISIKSLSEVTIIAGANGSVAEAGTHTVYKNEPMTIMIAPNPGYHVSKILVNGNEAQGESTLFAGYEYFTFTPDQDEVTVEVEFSGNAYTIYSTINNYLYEDYGVITGTITPVGITNVDHGENQSYNIQVAEHYHIMDVLVNGESAMDELTMIDAFNYTYDFVNVDRNSTIQVVLTIDSNDVIMIVNSGKGTVQGVATDATDAVIVYTYPVAYGADFFATVVPETGYRVNSYYNSNDIGAIQQYYMFDIVSTQTLDIYFTKNTYTIATQAYGQGEITDGVTFEYDPEYVYDYTVTPNTGYYISSVTVNGEEQTIADITTFSGSLSNIAQDYEIVANFAMYTYEIAATAGNGGSITPVGTTVYNYGTSATYTATAATGYYIASVTVDGTTTSYTATDNMTTWSHTFANICANHSVSVTYAIHTYTITATAGADGTITPGTDTYNYGATQTYTITPNAGYYISTVTVDGEVVANFTGNTYTFVNITADHTIEATFTQHQYTITAGAAAGGTITPSGTTAVAHGGSQAYTVTPATGYIISTVGIDGVATTVNGATFSHTFSNVTEDHEIFANFQLKTYTVTTTQPANGLISPIGIQTVDHGSSVTVHVTPNAGYDIENIKVNGTNVTFTADATGAASHTISNITANTTVTATMKIQKFTITATAGANGAITPSGTATVNYGATQAYTITANAGYRVENVVVDGTSVGAVSSFTFANVTSNRTISATFTPIACSAPTHLYTSDIDYTRVQLNWFHDGADSYTVTYMKRGDANATIVPNITDNFVVIEDLDTNTHYEWTVKAICVSTSSVDAPYATFKTKAAPVGPGTGIGTFDLTQIKVYSNLNNVYILNDAGYAIQNVEIFDMYGKLIFNGKALNNPEVINLNTATGTYIVRIVAEGKVGTYKVHIANN